jgi:integrase
MVAASAILAVGGVFAPEIRINVPPFSIVHDMIFPRGAQIVVQGKTGSKVEIPFELRLDAFGMSLGEVYEQCRRTGVLSRFLIHQTEPYGNSPRGSAIWKDTISRRFTDVLIGLGIDWGDKTPPTFHEIRSLSERLYSAQGGVDTQQLLGHSDPDSTLLYHNNRGAEWVRVRIGPAGI